MSIVVELKRSVLLMKKLQITSRIQYLFKKCPRQYWSFESFWIRIIFFDFHDLLNVEYDYNSCRTINLNLVKIIIFLCLPKVFLDHFILLYYNSGSTLVSTKDVK